jgi:hypothetical protein
MQQLKSTRGLLPASVIDKYISLLAYDPTKFIITPAQYSHELEEIVPDNFFDVSYVVLPMHEQYVNHLLGANTTNYKQESLGVGLHCRGRKLFTRRRG